MTSQLLFVGMDVSKARLDTALRPDGRTFGDRDDSNGTVALVACLLALEPALIVLEAIGAYERPLAEALQVAHEPGEDQRQTGGRVRQGSGQQVAFIHSSRGRKGAG
jgi:hypothetical protein